ncbi:MAG: ABC transporter ATP-binding protein [Acidobacteria bacterium]|nr:ABC transporter ATP-binding protein [Acidobacteriota bacterium]
MGWMFVHGTSEDAKLDLATTRRVLRRTVASMAPYRRHGLIASAFLIVFTGTTLAGPLLVRRAIDHGLADDNVAVLNSSVVAYVIVAALSYVSYRFAITSLARLGEGFLRDLRNRVFAKMLSQSMDFYDTERAGVLVSRMTSDVDSLQELVQMGLLMFAGSVLLLMGTATVLFLLSAKLMLICLVALPFVAIASVKFQRDSNKAYLAVRDNIGNTLSTLQEGISGVRVVQAFAREERQATQFAATNQELFRTHMASVRVQCWYLPIIEFAGAVTTAVALGVGGWMVRDGQISLGTVIAFILLLSGLFGPVQQLSELFNMVQSATAGLHKLYELLDGPISVDNPAVAVPTTTGGRIRIEHVSFGYGNGDLVVRDIDLDIDVGEKVAFVGPTGAGKSTVAKLVARFYDPTEGSITIGGIDLRSFAVDDLRKLVVVVPQEGYLFAGTIADNIRIARPGATDGQVRAALDAIGIADRFDQLPDGLSTEVRERGSRLSAGEKQLVSLARAALVDPEILVLDEATSSVDPGTESLVETAMDSLMQGRTVIAIAHRLSTSQRCDRVAVIVDGRLVELDTHDALIEQGAAYAALYEAWTAGHMLDDA